MKEGAALSLPWGWAAWRLLHVAAQCSGRLTAMDESTLPTLRPGYARCVRRLHSLLIGMLRYEFSQLGCPWCLEKRTGTPHGKVDAASCECRLLAR
jgi:hypothetical protein